MGFASNLLGNHGGVAISAVIDAEIDPNLFFCSLVHNFGRTLDQFRTHKLTRLSGFGE
jgi:hypothetical protein